MEIVDSHTENGAGAFRTTKSALLDLFVILVRGCSSSEIVRLFPVAWKESAEQLVRIIYMTRDPRNGKGERDISFILLDTLRENKPKTYALNIERIAHKYGRFKDLVVISRGKSNPELELNILSKQLIQDMEDDRPSLAAKWAPTEGSRYHQEAKIIANIIFPNDVKALEKYRKQILTPLRKKINVLECMMCSGKWDNINFSEVPSQAMLIYGRESSNVYSSYSKTIQKGAFIRHSEQRFREYQQRVKEGKEKINTSGVQPHQLVSVYLENTQNAQNTVDATIELQWSSLIEKLENAGNIGSALAVVDVSGSMSGLPINAAISLGLITARLACVPFRHNIITFHESPCMFNVQGQTLFEQFKKIIEAPWGMNTNLEAVFELIINMAKLHNVPQENMIKTIFIFTDMEFDEASTIPEETIYRNAQALYSNAGYKIPNIVFWNLSPNTKTFPIKMSQYGTAIVSGFSAELLKVFMSGIDFDPMNVLQQLLAKYNVDIDPSEL